MSFGGDPSLSHQTEEQRVRQWLWQIRDDARRELDRKALEPVLLRQHFHVEALERIETQDEVDGYRTVRAGRVLALAVFWTGDEATAARQRIVVGGMIAHTSQCFGQDCQPRQEEEE